MSWRCGSAAAIVRGIFALCFLIVAPMAAATWRHCSTPPPEIGALQSALHSVTLIGRAIISIRIAAVCTETGSHCSHAVAAFSVMHTYKHYQSITRWEGRSNGDGVPGWGCTALCGTQAQALLAIACAFRNCHSIVAALGGGLQGCARVCVGTRGGVECERCNQGGKGVWQLWRCRHAQLLECFSLRVRWVACNRLMALVIGVEYMGAMNKRCLASGVHWEAAVHRCRAIRVGVQSVAACTFVSACVQSVVACICWPTTD